MRELFLSKRSFSDFSGIRKRGNCVNMCAKLCKIEIENFNIDFHYSLLLGAKMQNFNSGVHKICATLCPIATTNFSLLANCWTH